MAEISTHRVDDQRRKRHQLALSPPLAPYPRRGAREVRLFEPKPAQLGHPQPEAEQRHHDRRISRFGLRVADRGDEHLADVINGRATGVTASFSLHAWHFEVPATGYQAEHACEL